MTLANSRWPHAVALIVSIVTTSAVQAQPGPITAEDVRRSIDNGVSFLRQQQDRVNGTWPEVADYRGGVTALCTLALLNSGVPTKDPSVQRALAYLRSLGEPTKNSKTYSIALRIMVFCAADPKRDLPLIQRYANWLERIQLKTGPSNGSWSYDQRLRTGDKSNSQFALLGLYEAERAGVKIDESTWRRAEDYWMRQQHGDGSWSYTSRSNDSSGSMTCAGIASLAITSGRLSRGDARVEDGRLQCCGEQEDNTALLRGLEWLGRNFSVTHNPSNSASQRDAGNRRGQGNWYFYYIYGVERAGRMTGRRFIGQHDWYREGAEFLLSLQDRLTGAWRGHTVYENQPNIATAFSLLFLSKGRRPLLVAKLRREPENDWNYHRSDLANLTRHVESKWKMDMTWQVVDVRAAATEDLLQAPVLFISGRNELRLSRQQVDNLHTFVNNGGFLFFESCCGGKGFDRQFRELMKEMFPDNPLRLLPPDHPVWYAEEKVDPETFGPLWGIDACCRTSVVYSPEDLSCFWELASAARGQQYPRPIQRKINSALAVGTNVLAYATNRQLKEKLDIQQIFSDDDVEPSPARATLRIAKLRHGGGSDDAPAALTNLLRMADYHVQLPVGLQRMLVSPKDETLPDYPILFTHGRRAYRWSDAERKGLAAYLAAGGVLLADSICASDAFTRSFRQEIESIFPNQTWQDIPPTHAMFTSEFGGYDLNTVTVREPRRRAAADGPLQAPLRKTVPRLEGIEIDGRFAVIFSPLDISCALENHASLGCKGYIREDAAKLGINVILYALQ